MWGYKDDRGERVCNAMEWRNQLENGGAEGQGRVKSGGRLRDEGKDGQDVVH